jgi:hypothetical protein
MDVGILQIFFAPAVIQRTVVDNIESPAFLESGLVEKIAVCAHIPNPSA